MTLGKDPVSVNKGWEAGSNDASTLYSSFEDMEELRKRFEDFRSQHEKRTRLPEELWRAAAEIAERRGMNLVCRCLRLDANSLKKWMGKNVSEPRRKRAIKKGRPTAPPAAFVELLTAAAAAAS